LFEIQSRSGRKVIEHFRTQDGRVAVRETGDKIQIIDQQPSFAGD
jgi:hypothetical protein